MARRRLMRGTRVPLLPAVKRYLLTGEAVDTRNPEAAFQVWLMRGRLREGVMLWLTHREQVRAEWEASGQPGECFGERHFRDDGPLVA